MLVLCLSRDVFAPVLSRVEDVVVVGPPQLSPLLAGLHSIPAVQLRPRVRDAVLSLSTLLTGTLAYGCDKSFLFLSWGVSLPCMRWFWDPLAVFCFPNCEEPRIKCRIKVNLKLYIFTVFFTVIPRSRPATAQRWAEECTFAFNPRNIIQTLTRPPWRYFSVHPGPVPMEKCQENFTTWICSFANAAKAGRLSTVLFASVFDLLSRYLSFVLSQSPKHVPWVYRNPSESDCFFKGTRSPCF